MAQKRTFCFKYEDIHSNICYAWITAYSLDGAKIKFENECPDCFKLLSIRETFTWQ